MSIAVSAVIRTPVGLRLLQAGLGACALLAAWPLSGFWSMGHAPGVAGGYGLGWPAAVLSAGGGLFFLALSCWRTKPQTLDISPVGQIRLTVYLEHGAGVDERDGAATPAPGQMRSVLCLLPASTLWPDCLLLRLGNEEGRVVSVLVRPGARSCPAFRPLAVACRAIAARGREQ